MTNIIMNLPVYFDGFNIEVTQIFGADDKVVMQGYYCGTNKATGNTFKFNAAQLILRIFHIPGGGAFI